MTTLIAFFSALLVLFVSTYLFKRAAGSLSISKLNLISFVYYEIIILAFVGAFAVLMGFRDHYLIKRINDERVIIKTCLIIAYTMIALPAFILFFNRIFLGRNIRAKLDAFYGEKTVVQNNEQLAFLIISFLAMICLAAAVYVFRTIRVFPLLELIRGRGENDLLRQQVSREFAGNSYIRNIIFLSLTPLISYLSYIYWRVSRHFKRGWFCLFFLTLILSILAKTYDLEKAPILLYFFYFLIIEIVLDNQKIKKIVVFGGTAAFIVVVGMYYLLFGYSGKLLTISSGPGGRIFMTQIATLFLHVKVFPNMRPYLAGASLPTILTKLLNIDQSWVRSGRVVMEIFNPEAVAAGTAGVMNTLFVGEAYANWGLAGVFAAPVFVALPLSLTLAVILRLKKSPVFITLYVALFNAFTGSLFGGFVDYLYNAGTVILIALFLIIGLILESGRIQVKKLR